MSQNKRSDDPDCMTSPESLLQGRKLIIVSNRGPFNFSEDENGSLQIQRSGGGLVTALLGLTQNIGVTWVASAINDVEKKWQAGKLSLDESDRAIDLELVPFETDVYNAYYNIISNPLLWFLQHSMWDSITNPTINKTTWEAWQNGYVAANQKFAQVVARRVRADAGRTVVMLQDYHLYLLPRMLRRILRKTRRSDQLTLTHFVHIPWPGSDELRILPQEMRQSILEGLMAVDILGFQTYSDTINFLQSAATHLPGVSVSYKKRKIWYRNHPTIVRDFPISIDVRALQDFSIADEVQAQKEILLQFAQNKSVILRVDRTEPSKNIVRGFEAFEQMLDQHPEHCGNVIFIALLVPSRLEVDEYRDYHDKFMAAAGWINSKYGTREWEPVRIMLGENYARAVAGLQIYDVLLVNSIADGMNLVAKEGPAVNTKNGVLVLSESTGAFQQLQNGSLVISPCDIQTTAEALHEALTMNPEERRSRAEILRAQVEGNDIYAWFCDQINEISRLGYLP